MQYFIYILLISVAICDINHMVNQAIDTDTSIYTFGSDEDNKNFKMEDLKLDENDIHIDMEAISKTDTQNDIDEIKLNNHGVYLEQQFDKQFESYKNSIKDNFDSHQDLFTLSTDQQLQKYNDHDQVLINTKEILQNNNSLNNHKNDNSLIVETDKKNSNILINQPKFSFKEKLISNQQNYQKLNQNDNIKQLDLNLQNKETENNINQQQNQNQLNFQQNNLNRIFLPNDNKIIDNNNINSNKNNSEKYQKDNNYQALEYIKENPEKVKEMMLNYLNETQQSINKAYKFMNVNLPRFKETIENNNELYMSPETKTTLQLLTVDPFKDPKFKKDLNSAIESINDPETFKRAEKLIEFQNFNENLTKNSKEIQETANGFLKAFNKNIQQSAAIYENDNTLYTSGGKAIKFNFNDEKDTENKLKEFEETEDKWREMFKPFFS